MTDTEQELRPVEAKDRSYMERLAARGVPHMAIYYRMREAGIDVKEHHLRNLSSPRFGVGESKDYSIRLRPEVMEGMRDIAAQLGYVFYTNRGEVGMLPPLFEAIVNGQVSLTVNGVEDRVEPRKGFMRSYTVKEDDDA